MSLENLPPLDVQTFLRTAIVLAFLGVVFILWRGVTNIRVSRELNYYRLRRERLLRGWRMVFFGFVLLIFAIALQAFGERAVYRIYPITMTPSITPTITVTPSPSVSPTITPTPTITLTPAVTDTATATPTPHIPLAVGAQFEAEVTPPAEAIFSELTFAQGFDAVFRPINPGTIFQNPVDHIYGIFSFDQMVNGAQWTALWYRDGELVYFETLIWDGGTGGLGFTDWQPEAEAWVAGLYQIQVFVGYELKQVGEFLVEGNPITSTPTATQSLTPTLTLTITPTVEAANTGTPTPSRTPYPTLTRTATPTRWPTQTRTVTPEPTDSP